MRVTVTYIEKNRSDLFASEKVEEFFDVISSVVMHDGSGQITVETEDGPEVYSFPWVTRLVTESDDEIH